ncbi:hypothetical protein [Sphaerisporangium flaviroseum]|uniref:class I SAM-dependent methyltransferase n=1 Tax=Sphaerisporangium flaviroseum TaxID=509199 RepID=UPI0031EA0F8F
MAPELSRDRTELVNTLVPTMTLDPLLWRGYNTRGLQRLGEAPDDAAIGAYAVLDANSPDYLRDELGVTNIQWLPELVKLYQRAQAEGFAPESAGSPAELAQRLRLYKDSDPVLWTGRELAQRLGRFTELSDEAFRGLARMGEITGLGGVGSAVRGGIAFWSDDGGAFAEILRVLRPGGELRVTTGGKAPSIEIWERMASLGFVDIKIEDIEAKDIRARLPRSTE